MDVVERGEDLWIAHVENVLLVVWPAAVGGVQVDKIELQARSLATRHPAGVVHMNIVERTSVNDTPDQRLRGRLGAILRDPQYGLLGSAIVYRGEGFAAAAMRGVVSSVMMVAGAGNKLHIAGTIDTAVAWLEGVLRKAGANVPSPLVIRRAANELLAERERAAAQNTQRK